MKLQAGKAVVLLGISVGIACLCSCTAHSPAELPHKAPLSFSRSDALLIIPRPKSLTLTGTRLRLDGNTRLVIAHDARPLDRMAALSVQQELRDRFGLPLLPILTAERAKPGGARIVFGESSLASHPEGYYLRVGPRGAAISGHDPAGTFYGAQTFCQMLMRDSRGIYIPGAEVDDYPTLRWRGAHLFVGKEALPFHEKLIARIFAHLKMNNLVLQCEQAKWNTLGKAAPAWAMPKKDLRTEITFARRYGMTVTPLINSVGHMPWLFADPANLSMAEDPQTPYAADVSNPQTDHFLFRLYDEVLDTFGSNCLHIGGDEVTQRGRYPYRSRSRYPTVAAAYVAQVTRLHDHLSARGVRTMLWSDMLLALGEAQDAANAPSASQAAEMRSRLPKDIILTDWHYTADGPFPSPILLRRAGFGPVIGATWATPANITHFSRTLAEGQPARPAANDLGGIQLFGSEFDP